MIPWMYWSLNHKIRKCFFFFKSCSRHYIPAFWHSALESYIYNSSNRKVSSPASLHKSVLQNLKHSHKPTQKFSYAFRKPLQLFEFLQSFSLGSLIRFCYCLIHNHLMFLRMDLNTVFDTFYKCTGILSEIYALTFDVLDKENGHQYKQLFYGHKFNVKWVRSLLTFSVTFWVFTSVGITMHRILVCSHVRCLWTSTWVISESFLRFEITIYFEDLNICVKKANPFCSSTTFYEYIVPSRLGKNRKALIVKFLMGH